MAEIQQADISTRRKAIKAFIATAIAGLLVIWAFEQNKTAIFNWVLHDPSQTASRVKIFLWIICALMEIPLLGAAVFFWNLGGRILAAERFPPPGSSVIRDTRVLEGQQARARGYLFRAFAVLFVLLIAATSVVFWRLTSMFNPIA